MKRFWGFFGFSSVILATLLVVHLARLPHEQMVVDFLNVGQGDAILITTPTGEQVLVDGGPEQFVLGELGAVMPFLDRTIDLLVLTHPHADHVMGLIPVLRQYKVGAVLLTGVAYENPIYEIFLEEIQSQNIPIWVAHQQSDFAFGEVYFDILFPFQPLVGQEFDNVNNSSIVMKISFYETDILLTGDAEHEVEEALLTVNAPLEAEVLKAGHHGSRTASGLEFLEAVSPEKVIIQCGADNDFGHPHEETLAILGSHEAQVLRNDLDDRIRLTYPVYSNSHSNVN